MKIEYYYGFPSPFAFLGLKKFQEIAKKYNAVIIEKPCDLVAGIFAKTGGIPVPQRSPQRQKYRLDGSTDITDLQRLKSKRHGL